MSVENLVKGFKVGDIAEGIVLLQGLSYMKTKFGKNMAMFTTIGENGVSASGTIFDEGLASTLQETGEGSLLALVSYKVVDYQGKPSVQVSQVQNIYDLTDEIMVKLLERIPAKPNVEAISKLLKDMLSEKGMVVARTILNAHAKELSVAMAAMYGGVHDGVVGGLLNHMRKVLRYTQVAMDEYEGTLSPTERDLVALGIAFHDIGKILELKNGSYTDISIVPHTFLGIEILMEHRAVIEDTYGHMFYRELQAIISQHHGQYGERPLTVYAYIVHQIDLIDSRLSGLQKLLTPDSSGQRVSFDEYKLKFNRYS